MRAASAPTGCTADDVLLAFVHGKLTNDSRDEVVAHLDTCETCRLLVVDLVRTHGRATSAEEEALPAGTQIGRYVILERVGVGAMGAVYAALDPDLDRKVALKLLHGTAERQDVLVREAQAMARLAHPNVISVYEVGTVDDTVYVAMELVDGVTLSEWMRSAPRRWQDTVALFIEAGRGLQAAHSVGIVHRDFKPDNVLVGADGRARVTDFGLARLAASDAAIDRSAEPASLTRTISQTGTLAGTPVYMAPELHRGAAASAASDQFSFSVALFEALQGERPFAGSSLAELVANVTDGRVPATRGIPTWLERALRTGLATQPEDRFPTMDAMLAAIQPRSSVTRGWVLAAIAVVGITVGAGIALRGRHQDSDCARAGDPLASVWNPQRRQAIASAFKRSNRPYAGDTADRVDKNFDQYADAWIGMRIDSCKATNVRRDQSAALLDLRTACLDRRLAELDSLLRVFGSNPDGDLVDNAVHASLALTDLAACADTTALTSASPPPATAVERSQLAALVARLEITRAALRAGRPKEASRLDPTLVADARTLGHAPFLAEVLLLDCAVRDGIGDNTGAEAACRDALQVAATARDHARVAEAAVQLVRIVGYGKGRIDEALAMSRLADAEVSQAGDDPRLRAKFLTNRGILYSLKGDLPSARTDQEAALALRSAALGPTHLETAESFHDLGGVLWQMGKFDDALVAMRKALEMTEAILGPDHPDVGKTVLGIGMSLRAQGKLDEALPNYERALKIFKAALGPDHRSIASAMDSEAMVYDKRGDDAEAIRLFDESRAMRERLFGKDDELVSDSLKNLGEFLMSRKRYAEARPLLERSLTIRETKLGADHPKVGAVLAALGECLLADGHAPEARVQLERAIKILDGKGGNPAILTRAKEQLALATR
ncbi:MAG TPA: tetratricopeptide repeat protein [Kofleriaceae bacterium]|jgi:tetratricopeptide (TPR) repeat protein